MSAIRKRMCLGGLVRIASGVLLLLAGCSGDIGSRDDGPGSGSQQPLLCGGAVPQAGESRVRRLTPLQYRNSIRDLLGVEVSADLDADEGLVPAERTIRKFDEASAELSTPAIAYASALPECDQQDDACVQAFIEQFGLRAFRRPIDPDEREWLTGAFESARTQFSFDESLGLLARVMLESPQFLYVFAQGTPIPESPHGLRRLTGYEVASRLSYFLWDTTPSRELLDAAAQGRLDTPEGLVTEAQAMLLQDQARHMVRDFVASWLQLNGGKVHFGIDELTKDPSLFPEFTPQMRADLRTELQSFVEHVVFDLDGTLETLFIDTSAYLNGPLADLYGLANGPESPEDWQWVQLDPSQRGGLVTRAAFLSVFATQSAQSPIRRGTFLLREILCLNQPPPPPLVDDTPVQLEDGELLTIRDKTSARTQGAECQGCHKTINSIGFAFEHYDAIGRYQDVELGTSIPIDASGELTRSGNSDGPVSGAIEMSERLGESETVMSCVAEKWLEHALRRSPTPLDECTVNGLVAQLQAGGTLRDFILGIVASDAFVHVNPGPEGAP